MEFTLTINEEVRRAAPRLRVAVITAEIENCETSDELWAEIEKEAERIRGEYPMDAVRLRPAIDATRAAYKACGKEPNRYRPSAEALCRRCVKGMDLYRSLAVIDLINLLSLKTGHSIGGFDADAVAGPSLALGVGREGEPYEAIHRGPLNIAGMPVIRDTVGGIGTPTSDNERTKLTRDTRHLLITLNMYDGGPDADEIIAETKRLLRAYAHANNIIYNIAGGD